MAYSKQTWVRGEKVASVKLNHMEDGIAAISANGAIDTANLANASVTNAKLDQEAVDSNNIRTGAIITENLADGAVTLAKLADAVKEHFALADDVSKLKSALLKSASAELPCTIYPFTDKANLTLSGYRGKHVFISNKNLLPQIANATDHGVTCTRNADGSITLSGTADGAASLRIPNSNMPQIGKGTYTLSVMNPSAIGDNSTFFELFVNDSQASKCQCKLNTANNKITFTIDDGEIITFARLRISSGVVIPSDYTLYPQLEAGTEKTDFVAHEGSNLTPNTSPINDVAVFPEYTYICADSGVTGSVYYYINSIDILDEQVSTLDERVTALEAKKFTGKKIVCFGDSITGNYQPPADYPSMIAEITGATVYNAGFGGCCMSDNGQTRKDFTMCRLTDAIVAGDFSAQRNSGVSITYGGTSIDYVPSRLTMLEGIDWSDIDYITIAYGTNDWNGNYGLDNANDPLDTTTYIGAFRYSVEKLLAAYPNIKIMVLTPLWRWWDTNTGMPSEIHTDYIDSNDYAKGTGYKLWQYGDALVAAAKLYHIPVFDLYWNCMMTKQNRLEYFNATDGTHPKLAGIQMMSEMISAHMESVY